MGARITVLASWVITTVVIGLALFSTPYMSKVWRGEAVESRAGVLGMMVVLAIPCGIPWLFAASLPATHRTRQYVFALATIAIAWAFYVPIATGHDFSIGLNIIFACFALGLLTHYRELLRRSEIVA